MTSPRSTISQIVVMRGMPSGRRVSISTSMARSRTSRVFVSKVVIGALVKRLETFHVTQPERRLLVLARAIHVGAHRQPTVIEFADVVHAVRVPNFVGGDGFKHVLVEAARKREGPRPAVGQPDVDLGNGIRAGVATHAGEGQIA